MGAWNKPSEEGGLVQIEVTTQEDRLKAEVRRLKLPDSLPPSAYSPYIRSQSIQLFSWKPRSYLTN